MHDLPLGSIKAVIPFIYFQDNAGGCSQTVCKDGAKLRDMAFLHGHAQIPLKSQNIVPLLHNEIVINL